MRLMSFFHTQEAMRAGTKTVTRRWGWAHLKPGDYIQPIVKGQGLGKGGKVQYLCPPIQIVRTAWEPLHAILARADAEQELAREGLPNMSVFEFFDLLRSGRPSHKTDDWRIHRIEFRHTPLMP